MSDALSAAIRRQNREGGLGVITELKQRRHEGVELLGRRSARDIASTYQAAGATAISVVTNRLFGGSMGLLEEAASADTGLPILRKDLICCDGDVRDSSQAGASAVLLVLSLLDVSRVVDLAQSVREENMEPFVEVSTREEIEQLQHVYDGILAINNANIKTHETQSEGITRSLRLIDDADPRIWVSASCIKGSDDIRRLANAGFDAVLVGTHLLQAEDLLSETSRIVAAARAGGRQP